MNGEGFKFFVKGLSFLYLSCITHAQLRKGANRIECEIGCVV